MSEDLSDADREELAKYLGYGSSAPETKHSVHAFLHNVATADDTTKLGFLKEEEIGMPRHPIRTYKLMGMFAEKVMGNNFLKEYFNAKSEIVTSTSLSREAKLLTLAVIQKREIADVTKQPRKANAGWFGSKKRKEEGESVE